ncbi:MAG: carboxymuconolactone decarboxylase family protein [Dehalococcoidia bacterium]
MPFDSETTSRPRIAPLEAPFTPDVERSLAGMMGGSDRPPLALFRALLRNYEAGDRIRPLGSYFLTKGTLPARERELVIHRVTARLGAEYEWGVHAVVFAQALGLPEQWVDATAAGGHGNPAFDERESLVVQFVDELCETSRVSDELWAELAARWSEEQLIELLMLVGWYHMISFVVNGLRVELEPWGRRFPLTQSPLHEPVERGS